MTSYPRQSEMQRQGSALRAQLHGLRCGLKPKPPHNGASLLELERQAAAWAQMLADLIVAIALIASHGLDSVRRRAAEAARARHTASGQEGRLLSKGWKQVTIRLHFGRELQLWTPYYRVDTGHTSDGAPKGRGQAGAGCYPVLEQLGVQHRVTPALTEHIARQAILCSSYQEAVENLERHGVKIPMTTFIPVAVQMGQRALDRRDAELQAACLRPLPATTALAGRRVQVSIDGGRAKTRQTQDTRPIGRNGRRPVDYSWREPRVVTVHVFDDDGQMCSDVLYEVCIDHADGVLKMLTGLLRMLGAHKAAEVVFISDGASWIWQRLDKVVKDSGICPNRVRYILDFYHAAEHIHDALKACKDVGEEERKAEFGRMKGLLLNEEWGAEMVIAELKARARGRRAKPINKEIRFLSTYIEHMEYFKHRKASRPIGSGVVESAVRRVINLRFKSASMAWREDNLEPLLYLRAILKAGHWERFILADVHNRHWVDPDIFRKSIDEYEKRKAA